MSLVNQMLKDLARRSKPVPGPDMILSGLLTTTASKSRKTKLYRWFIACSLFLILISISIIIQPYFLSKNRSLQHGLVDASIIAIPHPISPHDPNATVAPIIESSMQQPVVLTGITLQAQKERTILRLLLNKDSLYRINSYEKNRLVIVLENTRLVANLPQIDTMKSAVKMIRMINQIDGSLKILLVLNTGTELKHIGTNKTDKLPELQIDLAYKNAVDNGGNNLPQGEILEEQQMSTIKKISYDTKIDDEYQQAINLATQGQNNEAIKRLTMFLKKHPASIPARKSLVELLLKQNDVSNAEGVIDVGLQQEPLYPSYVQLKAQILVDKGKLKQALSLLEKAQPPLEENLDYHAFIAALYQRQNKFQLAEKLYERLVNQQPTNSIWWLGLGIARESLNKNKQALDAYTKANSTENLSPELKVYVENRIHELLLL